MFSLRPDEGDEPEDAWNLVKKDQPAEQGAAAGADDGGLLLPARHGAAGRAQVAGGAARGDGVGGEGGGVELDGAAVEAAVGRDAPAHREEGQIARDDGGGVHVLPLSVPFDRGHGAEQGPELGRGARALGPSVDRGADRGDVGGEQGGRVEAIAEPDLDGDGRRQDEGQGSRELPTRFSHWVNWGLLSKKWGTGCWMVESNLLQDFDPNRCFVNTNVVLSMDIQKYICLGTCQSARHIEILLSYAVNLKIAAPCKLHFVNKYHNTSK